MQYPNHSVFNAVTRSTRLAPFLLILILLLQQPQEASACDPNCDFVAFFVRGTPLALGTIVVAPLLGLAANERPDPPYKEALALTTLATTTAWIIGVGATGPSGEQYDDVSGLTLLPVAAGFLATFLTYRFLPRQENKKTGQIRYKSPLISIMPGIERRAVRLSWHF